MDVSGSMRAADVLPDRLTASQEAAKKFVATLPRDVRVGVVSYGGTAQVVQPPTRDRDDVVAAIDRFRLQPGTAIGNGLVIALATLFPTQDITIERIAARHLVAQALSTDATGTRDAPEPPPVIPGSYKSAVIVLLSDGQNTTGVEPLDAAEVAASRGVKVFTVGFGTKDGDTVTFAGWTIRVRLDEDTLKAIAATTRGEYFYAATGPELQRAYEAMSSRFGLERRETEITSLFAGAAALLLMAGAAMSVWWHGRVF
jgi:Ca-activated chloride channel family protein